MTYDDNTASNNSATTGCTTTISISNRNLYGYEDASPTTAKKKNVHTTTTTTTTTNAGEDDNNNNSSSRPFFRRRPSLVENGNWESSRLRRRSTIQFGGSNTNNNNDNEVEYRLPGTPVPIRRRRSIGFDSSEPETIVVVIPSRPDLDNNDDDNKEGDCTRSWLEKSDYDDISKANGKIIKYVEKTQQKQQQQQQEDQEEEHDGPEKEAEDDGTTTTTMTTTISTPTRIKKKTMKLCTRGLEGMMASSSQDVDRKHARDAVLDEQRTQRSQGVFNEDRIAQKYHYVTIQSTLEASDRANTDEAEIQAYLKETRRMLRRMSV